MNTELVLLRHGESVWNRENRFTGWEDVDLTEKGIAEAREAGRHLRTEGFSFDEAYTSLLQRAIKTLYYVLDELDLLWIPVHKTWRLNERHYGALQGLNKAETAKKFSEEQVLIWRRSYDVPPPELSIDDPRFPGNDKKYINVDKRDLPFTETLKSTSERFLPYWEQTIVPSIKQGKKVLIAAHGNSLRALIKHLDNIPDDKIVNLNIPTGIPLVYQLDERLRPIDRYYLGNASDIQRAIDSVAEQGKIS